MFDYSPQMFSSSGAISPHHILDPEHAKLPLGHLYLRQPRTVEIIQLVEGPPPPPRRISSVVHSSQGPSSSSYSSSYDDSSSDDDDDSDASSYCSSEEDVSPLRCGSQAQPWSDDAYAFRMKRIHAWRDTHTKAVTAPRPDQSRSTPRRKSNENNDTQNDDHLSQRSKRPRPQTKLEMYACPACDAFFSASHSLRQHGTAAQATEACRLAVEYDFE